MNYMKCARAVMISGATFLLSGATAPEPHVPSLAQVRTREFTVMGIDGTTIHLSSLLGNGQPLVIEFWATWCAPCHKLLPHLVALKKEHQEDLTIVGLTVEDPTVDMEKVRSHIKDQGVNFPIAFAPPALFQFMNNRPDIAVPKLFVFDASGTTVAYIPRYSPFTGRKLDSAVKDALSRRGRAGA